MNNNINQSEKKQCTMCKCDFPLNTEFFNVDRKGVKGLSSRCKGCLKKLRESKREEKRIYDEKRRQELGDLRRKQSREYYYSHTDHKKEYDRIYREKNKELIQKNKRNYYLNNKDKVHKRSSINVQKRRARKKLLEDSFTLQEWNKCVEFFENKCAYCGKESKLQQEHFIPLTKGGEYTRNNIIPACKTCNCSKLNRDFFEWYQGYRYYSKERERKILKYLNYNLNKQQQIALL